MLLIGIWVVIYSLVVTASILFLGSPSTLVGNLTVRSLAGLLIDWRFLIGGFLALGARFIFIIINNLASKQDTLAQSHLSITAIATTVSIVFVLVANHYLLGEQLRSIQLIGAAVMLGGVFLVFR
jgi:drug/metabolite transporter (DMT)-like permease